MMWLAGQIWLWLLISFALGAGITGFLLTRRQPAKPEISTAEQHPEPGGQDRVGTRAEDSAGSRAHTEAPERISGDIPLPAAAYDRFEPQDDDLTQQINLGGQSGTLPRDESWRSRNEWPGEDDGHTTEIVDDSGHRPRER
ncbi:hypothetical protein SAMN05216266_12553 [Amycolatopsis marina]|uniref:Uncharacterized protein n=1 Tax=Amycolatopsis marina TaxID=490629 RepID=A0A1I1CD72_9PSEU|nr:hypothetical protein [Amycolatopsis marina]SFB60357.1 hypothetical protein SAMN05216266_12553 [Amycolatopsis marina]